MWRNPCLNDTYEPGSTFKIITMSAGLEAGVVSKDDRFYCPGYKVVEDRRIHCAKRTGHGAQNFVEGAQNSCNPVFIEVGLRLGVERYYKYFRQFGLFDKTGVDLPGEAGTIMHAMKNMGEVELATVSFRAVLPDHSHPACHNSKFPDQRRKKDYAPFRSVRAEPRDGTEGEKLTYPVKEGVVSVNTSKQVREILETVVSQGSRQKCKDRGLLHRWKNSYFTDTAQKCQSLYFLISGIRSCRRSSDPGAVHHSRPTGDLLWRNHCSTCDPQYLRKYPALSGNCKDRRNHPGKDLRGLINEKKSLILGNDQEKNLIKTKE